jgi:hypothetical protein
MTVDVGDTIRVTARLEWAGAVDVQNVFEAYCASGTPQDDDDVKADLADWLEDFYTPFLGALPDNLAFIDLDFYNVTNSAPMGQYAWPTLTAGTAGTTEISASGVAAVITAFTNVVRHHGRKFIGPIHEAAIDAGVLNAATMTALATMLIIWVTPFVGGTTGNGWVPGVTNRATSAFNQFRDAVVRNVPGYQRRRKANVGS